MKTIVKTWSKNERQAGRRTAVLHVWGLGFDHPGQPPESVHFTYKVTNTKGQVEFVAVEVGEVEAAAMYQSLKDFRQRRGLPT